MRIRQEVPKGLVIHYGNLAPEDVERVKGVPVTTPARSIRDAHASHLGNELVAEASATDDGLEPCPWPSQTGSSVSCSAGPGRAAVGPPAAGRGRFRDQFRGEVAARYAPADIVMITRAHTVVP